MDVDRDRPRALRRNQGWVLKAVLAVLALIVVGVIAGIAYVRANPLALFVKTTRGQLADAGLKLESFETSAGRLAYWEGGTGPTLVLIHGAGDQAGAFQGVVERLLENHRLLLPDVPGHGDSDPSDGPLTMTAMYGGVAEFLDAKGGDDPLTLIGSSMGGWISLIHALRRPEAVARVIGINSSGLLGDRSDLSLVPPDREAARKLMQALRDPSSEPLPDFVLDDLVERSANGPMARMIAAWPDLETFLLEGRLGEIAVPVDLVWGESDQLLSLAYAERMRAGLPRARLTRIETCGHHPANECPAKLAETLDRVLALPPPEPAAEVMVEADGPAPSPEEAH